MARLTTFWDKKYASPEFGTRAFAFDVSGSGSVHIIFTRNGSEIYRISLNAGRHERWFAVNEGDSVCAEGEASEDLVKNKICVLVSSPLTAPVTEPLGPIGGTKMWTINTQKNLTGTVEKTTGYLLWHITSPLKRDVSYGGPDATPATWIDEKGVEQVAVVQTSGWGKLDVALDTNQSFGMAEIYKDISEVDIISEKSGYTTQLRYPKKGNNTGTYILLGAIALGLAIIFGGKK